MTEHDIAEQSFKNGYTRGYSDARHDKAQEEKQRMNEVRMRTFGAFCDAALREERKHESRMCKDLYYLNIAKTVSMRSTCLKRQYGAVIVKNDEIISTGYNGSPRGEENCCDRGKCSRMDVPHNSGDYSDCHSVHAEMNAIISAPRSEMLGATLYLYGREGDTAVRSKPCPICERLIKNAGIISVIGAADDE